MGAVIIGGTDNFDRGCANFVTLLISGTDNFNMKQTNYRSASTGPCRMPSHDSRANSTKTGICAWPRCCTRTDLLGTIPHNAHRPSCHTAAIERQKARHDASGAAQPPNIRNKDQQENKWIEGMHNGKFFKKPMGPFYIHKAGSRRALCQKISHSHNKDASEESI
jgi:hypothetical protein